MPDCENCALWKPKKILDPRPCELGLGLYLFGDEACASFVPKGRSPEPVKISIGQFSAMSMNNPHLYPITLYVCGTKTIVVRFSDDEYNWYKVYDEKANVETHAKYDKDEAEKWEITADAFDSVGLPRPAWVEEEAKKHAKKETEKEPNSKEEK